jgi:hypothetical protein
MFNAVAAAVISWRLLRFKLAGTSVCAGDLYKHFLSSDSMHSHSIALSIF